MKNKIIALALVCIASVMLGCRSTHETEMGGEFDEVNNQMFAQMKTVRAQMAAAGASATDLREFDRKMVEMKKAMKQLTRQMERQMKAMEAAN